MNTRVGDRLSDIGGSIFREDDAVLVLFDTIFRQLESLYKEHSKEKKELLIEGGDIDFDSYEGSKYHLTDRGKHELKLFEPFRFHSDRS